MPFYVAKYLVLLVCKIKVRNGRFTSWSVVARKAKPLQVDAETQRALREGYWNCRDVKRRQHWQALYLLSIQPPKTYSISSILSKQGDETGVRLSERQIRKLIARFQEEGIAFLEREYRHQSPTCRGRGRKRKLSKEESQLLNHPDVLKGSLKDIQAWVLTWTGKTVSLATACRRRKEALSAREDVKAKPKKKHGSGRAQEKIQHDKQVSIFPVEDKPSGSGEVHRVDSS